MSERFDHHAPNGRGVALPLSRERRCLFPFNANLGKTPAEVLDALFADVKVFCAGADQSDDITAVLVRYNG